MGAPERSLTTEPLPFHSLDSNSEGPQQCHPSAAFPVTQWPPLTCVIADGPPLTSSAHPSHSPLLVYESPNSLPRILCLMFTNVQIHQMPKWYRSHSPRRLSQWGENATVLVSPLTNFSYVRILWLDPCAPGSNHIGGNPSSNTQLTLWTWVNHWTCLSLSFLI